MRFLGEAVTVKHVGAQLHHRGHHVVETQARVSKALSKIGWVAGAWSRGRGTQSNKRRIRLSVRVKVMKVVVKGVLYSFCKTRAWQMNQLSRVQETINLAIRRCIGVRLGMIKPLGLSNDILQQLTQWESFETSVRRATLIWIGHVARMPVEAPQKAAMYGWLENAGAKPHAPPKQAQWINSCLRTAAIPELDWFRLAQNRQETGADGCIRPSRPNKWIHRRSGNSTNGVSGNLCLGLRSRPHTGMTPTQTTELKSTWVNDNGDDPEDSWYAGNTDMATPMPSVNNGSRGMRQVNLNVQCVNRHLLRPIN